MEDSFGITGITGLSDEGLRELGFVLATPGSPPIDRQKALEEERLEKKTGYNAFGEKTPKTTARGMKPPEEYFGIFPEDSQARFNPI